MSFVSASAVLGKVVLICSHCPSKPHTALWTRFFPIAYKFQELLHKDKVIGDIHHVQADFGLCGFNTLPVTHRIFNADLAGGCQLDLGPYPLVWVSMVYTFAEHARDDLVLIISTINTRCSTSTRA